MPCSTISRAIFAVSSGGLLIWRNLANVFDLVVDPPPRCMFLCLSIVAEMAAITQPVILQLDVGLAEPYSCPGYRWPKGKTQGHPAHGGEETNVQIALSDRSR